MHSIARTLIVYQNEFFEARVSVAQKNLTLFGVCVQGESVKQTYKTPATTHSTMTHDQNGGQGNSSVFLGTSSAPL